MKRSPKGLPTALNLRVLRETFKGRPRISNNVEPTATEHLRRCLRAGLVEVDGSDLVLTFIGVVAVGNVAT